MHNYIYKMEQKIENLCNFIEDDLLKFSTDKNKLNMYIGILRSLNVFVLKNILKTTFIENEENEKIAIRLCKDFCIDYEKIKEIDQYYKKVNKYIDYFKKILYV